MRFNPKLLAVGSFLFVLVFAFTATGQRRGATTDPTFNSFWSRFKDAIAKNDKNRVGDMTKLPFMIEGIDRDRASFLKEYPALFTPRMRRCIPRAKVFKEGEYYEIFCGNQIFLFGRVDGVWKFVEIGAND